MQLVSHMRRSSYGVVLNASIQLPIVTSAQGHGMHGGVRSSQGLVAPQAVKGSKQGAQRAWGHQ